jgi:hypothetical protein
MPKILWKEPTPLWNETRGSKPHVVELKTDDFIPAFLQGVQEQENYLYDNRAKGRKLYQPIHQRYYLVTGSLVCRMVGFPDKTVEPQNGEKTYFVIRRKIGINEGDSELEFVWIEEPVTQTKNKNAETEVVKERGWHLLTPENQKHEERFPVHGIDITSQEGQRKIYYGYIPVGNRKKYVQPPHVPEMYRKQIQTPDLDDIIENYDKQLKPGELGMSEFKSRIVASLISLIGAPSKVDRGAEASFYFLVDLSDFLETWLEPVWKAVINSDPDSIEGKSKSLYEELKAITIKKNQQEKFDLLEALREINAYNFKNIAEGDENIPNKESGELVYDVKAFSTTRIDSDESDRVEKLSNYLRNNFSEKMSKALQHSNHQPESPVDPHRLLEAIKADQGQNLELRMVYEYDPDCPPVFSDPIHDLTFAAPLDNEAPARPVTIEMPDINLENMRKTKHGVQITMPPMLQKVVSRLNKGILKGDDLSESPQIGVGAVCIFSIPIITLCAFIVMMIFMIALNFIFWWLPFLKICLPLPKKGGSS